MPTADNSCRIYTERTESKALAGFARSNPTAREFLKSELTHDLVLASNLGKMDFVIQPPTNPAFVDPGCCGCTDLTPVQNIQIANNSVWNDNIAIYTIYWESVPGATEYELQSTDPAVVSIENIGSNVAKLTIDWDIAGMQNVPYWVIVRNRCDFKLTNAEILYCFLAGSLVAMADGSSKAIEDVAVGEKVIGAFGEHNEVLALHRSLLGAGRMMNINGEHHSTSHHPHVTAGMGFKCAHPSVVEASTYGREHEVLNAEGKPEMRMLHGLKKGRVEELKEGDDLKTLDGVRIVKSLEIYSLPEDTKLFNLVVGGSHTYHVDGYAVTGWPREDDFDYEAWCPKN